MQWLLRLLNLKFILNKQDVAFQLNEGGASAHFMLI